MKKLGKILGWVGGVILVVFLIFGWDWYRPRLAEIFKPKMTFQPYVVFAADNIYYDSTTFPPAGFVRREVMIGDTCGIGRKIILPIALYAGKLDSRIAVSSEGMIYYLNKIDLRTHRFNLKTMSDLMFITADSLYINPACSHDGRHILFEANLTGSGSYRDIFCADLDSANPKPRLLTNNLTFCGSPSYTNDDQQIVYDCTHAGVVDLWIMDRDGKNPRWIMQGGANGNYQRPACSPTNNWVAYQVNYAGTVGIGAALLNSKKQVIKSVLIVNGVAGECLNPTWTPDGKAIVFQMKVRKKIGVFVRDYYDVFVVEFNPDLPPSPKPLIDRFVLDNYYPCWLPFVSDSVENSVIKRFVDTFRKKLPGA